ncbi:MAG: SA1788 family PVL leukocidin-associated protein, partial [Staphylococcus sp.]|nr:SA1788 family PVL leukocidin-associated protein [Staphylococcus sp.]
EDRMRLVRLERQKELNLRRKKPHLFEVPQVHSRGEWCTHLMENDIFPRKVVRS